MVANRSAAGKSATEVTAEEPGGESADVSAGNGQRGGYDTGEEKSAAARPPSGETLTRNTAAEPSGRAYQRSSKEDSAANAGATWEKSEKEADAAAGEPKNSARDTDVAETDVEQTGAREVATKKTTTEKPSAVPQARNAALAPGELAVRSGEEPWTAEEVEEARAELEDEAGLRRGEIAASEEQLSGLMRDSGDGAGDDQADTGSKNITREHELALAGNAREMLYQIERALERLEAGTYGLCESCGNPIGKARMQAFPRATLCVECKQRQERR